MVASVLNSDRAIAMSIYVIKAFVKMREELIANETILRRLSEIGPRTPRPWPMPITPPAVRRMRLRAGIDCTLQVHD